MRCKYCKKRIWFWQAATVTEIKGVLLPPQYKKVGHLKCYLAKVIKARCRLSCAHEEGG